MKKRILTVFAILISNIINAQTPATGTLTFRAKDFNNNKGKAVIFLYRKADKLPGHPFATANSYISNREAAIIMPDIPFGDYAAILLHDENNNGEIDHSFGLPSEQLGYTNSWKLGFFSGMPTFAKLRFAFTLLSENQTIGITYKKSKS